MAFQPYVEMQYRGGWTVQQTWRTSLERPGPDGFDRVAVRGETRIEQGTRTFEQLLNALDRIDGRKVCTDFITGLRAGKTPAEASIPVPFGPDGEPLPETSLPAASAALSPPAQPAGSASNPARVIPAAAIQQSLFDEDL